jgi:hypothetical protein
VLLELTEQIAESLLGGRAFEPADYAGWYPEWTGAILGCPTTMHDLRGRPARRA